MGPVHKPFFPNGFGLPAPPAGPCLTQRQAAASVTAAGDGGPGYDAAGTTSVTPGVGARRGVLARATCRPIVAMAMKAR
jgi:hypothetical protein